MFVDESGGCIAFWNLKLAILILRSQRDCRNCLHINNPWARYHLVITCIIYDTETIILTIMPPEGRLLCKETTSKLMK